MLETIQIIVTISIYWYTTNQGIQIHCQWFD